MSLTIGSLSIILRNPLQDSMLLLILIIITIIAYFVMKFLRGKRAAYFGNLKTLERTHGYKVFHISSWVLLLKLVLIILLYLVATNSILISDYKAVSNTDYILLIDDSSSMAKNDYDPNRLSSAKNIAKKWINILPNSTRLSIVAFSSGIDVDSKLSNSKSKLLSVVDNINIDYTRSGTNLDYAIEYSLDEFDFTSNTNKTILLMTDGTESISNKTLDKAVTNKVKIVIFGIGSSQEKNSFENIPEEYRDSFNNLDFNETILDNIASRTGGIAYHVENNEELENSFEKATLQEVKVSLDSGYYIILLIAIISILELLIYARLGAL